MPPSRRTRPPTMPGGWPRRAASASAARTASRATRPPSPSSCATARRGRAMCPPPAWTTPPPPASRMPPRHRRAARSAPSRPSGSLTKIKVQTPFADQRCEMTSSAASLYQIDERGLELRRAYMGMTAAERELLGGMQAWASRNADAIGAKLADHTFSSTTAGQFLTDYANAKGIRVADLKHGWGAAQAGHFKAIFSE